MSIIATSVVPTVAHDTAMAVLNDSLNAVDRTIDDISPDRLEWALGNWEAALDLILDSPILIEF